MTRNGSHSQAAAGNRGGDEGKKNRLDKRSDRESRPDRRAENGRANEAVNTGGN